jgi:hypothetical protein
MTQIPIRSMDSWTLQEMQHMMLMRSAAPKLKMRNTTAQEGDAEGRGSGAPRGLGETVDGGIVREQPLEPWTDERDPATMSGKRILRPERVRDDVEVADVRSKRWSEGAG